MNAQHVYTGEWYIYGNCWPWLVTGIDDSDWGESAFTAVNEDGNEGIVFARELTPTEL